jgi:hypothetical protein
VVTCSVLAFGAENELIEAPREEGDAVEAQACRPTIACMAELVPAGFFEVESGYSARLSSGQVMHTGQLLLKYSLLDNLQLQLATNNVFLVGSGVLPRAFDGVMPGLKWKVNGQGSLMPSNAVSVHLMMPTHGFDDASQKTFDLQAWWYVSKDISIVHADFNLMTNIFDLGGKAMPQGLASLAVSVDLGRGFSVFTELYSAFGNAQSLPLDGGSLNGIGFSPIDELVFDVAGDVGLYQQNRAFTVYAGMTFVPNRRSRAPLTRTPTRLPTNAVAVSR